jgi:hypothetical protein
MYSRISSDEEAVKAWFRDYSSGLASVGIRLGLTSAEQCELEHRLVAVCPRFNIATATNGGFNYDVIVMDPIKSRWLDDHVSAQGDTWTKS